MCLMISYFHTFLPIEWNTLKKSSNKNIWFGFLPFSHRYSKGELEMYEVLWKKNERFECFVRARSSFRMFLSLNTCSQVKQQRYTKNWMEQMDSHSKLLSMSIQIWFSISLYLFIDSDVNGGHKTFVKLTLKFR